MSQEELKLEEEQVEIGIKDEAVTEADVEDEAVVLEGEIVEEGEDEDESGADPEAEIEAEPEPKIEIESAEDVIARLENELEAARAEADASRDQMQRVAAEFQNSKRRQEKQLVDSIARSAERVIAQLLPALDDFDLAFQNMPENISEEDEAWADGFRQIQKKLLTLLENEGVVVISVEGEFDPNRHEAISSEPNDEVESGHIIAALRDGYEHKGRVLRPALVRVAM